MKIRQGFVSNSSSSSFLCDITGEMFEGYDGDLSEFGLASCENNHTFLYEGYPEVKEWIEEDPENENGCYEIPARICPICNGKAKPELVPRLKSMMKNLNVTIEDLQ
jgi:hypothetical protein